MCLFYRSMCFLWTYLLLNHVLPLDISSSEACASFICVFFQKHVLPLDVSFLQKRVLPLDVSFLQKHVLPLGLSSSEACATSGCVFSGCVASRPVFYRSMCFFWICIFYRSMRYPGPVFYRSICYLWMCLFSSRMCCLWMCLQKHVLPLSVYFLQKHVLSPDVSFLQNHVLRLDLSVLQQPVLPWRCVPQGLFFAAQQRSLISIKRSVVQWGERISKKNGEMSYCIGEVIKKLYSLFQEAKPCRHSRLPPHLLASCDGGFSKRWREMCQLLVHYFTT